MLGTYEEKWNFLVLDLVNMIIY